MWDFVLFGPSELATQADNIDKLANTEDFTTFVISFFTPPQYLTKQPAGWFDFSSAEGALLICDYMVERLGKDQVYALNRGIPGVTDNQRSGDFSDCVQEKGNWELAYEHYGEYRREGGFDGTNLIMQAYPEAKIIHNANTAMSMGSVEAQLAADKTGEIFSTGWGGTGLELEAMRRGELDATPMRMGDDVGAAVAEAIKFHMEGRGDELPMVFLGRITIANDEMSVEEIDALEQEALPLLRRRRPGALTSHDLPRVSLRQRSQARRRPPQVAPNGLNALSRQGRRGSRLPGGQDAAVVRARVRS